MLGEGDTESRAHRWNAFITFFLLQAQSLWCHDPWLHLSWLCWPCLRFFPLCPKELFLSLYFKSWIWHSIIPLSGLNGKMAVECRWGSVIEFNIIWLVSVLVPEGWFICLSFSLFSSLTCCKNILDGVGTMCDLDVNQCCPEWVVTWHSPW